MDKRSIPFAALMGLVLLATGCATGRSGASSTPAAPESQKPSEPAIAPIVPASVFTDNMVLQRDKEVPVWGTGQPGRTVRVSFAGRQAEAVADGDGRWRVVFDPLQTSTEPRVMTIEYVPAPAEHPALSLGNVLVGEVWFCSGQSNMELGLIGAAGGKEETQQPEDPNIRLFLINKRSSPFPLARWGGPWRRCDAQGRRRGSWNGFSAVAYYFAKKLNRDLNVPVGVIQSAFGGAAIEPFIPFEELKTKPSLERFYNEVTKADAEYREALKTDPKARHPFAKMVEYNHLKAATLYNAMVHPVAPMALRGFLWYQGESNMGQRDYAEKQTALIAGWRRVFGQPDLSFYAVQIAPWGGYGGDSLPRFWEQQVEATSAPVTGLALTIDLGDVQDIHPVHKKEVGERLALLALAKTYQQQNIVYSGPVYKTMQVVKHQAVITFDFAAGGLSVPKGQELAWFTVAGADGTFYPAQAVIRGTAVIVTSDQVAKPVAVRYAWNGRAAAGGDMPAPNLYNKQGLPARPFRTDE